MSFVLWAVAANKLMNKLKRNSCLMCAHTFEFFFVRGITSTWKLNKLSVYCSLWQFSNWRHCIQNRRNFAFILLLSLANWIWMNVNSQPIKLLYCCEYNKVGIWKTLNGLWIVVSERKIAQFSCLSLFWVLFDLFAKLVMKSRILGSSSV